MRGAARMVAVNGGLETFGLGDFREIWFRKLVDEVDLLPGSIDRDPPVSCAEAWRAHTVSSYV